MEFDSRTFRNALGCFATGVAVITTQRQDGAPEGITVNSFSSLSLDPPLVMFSLDRKARCADCFAGAEKYAVHILAIDQAEISRTFATKGGPDWSGVRWQPGVTGCPIIAGALATLECEVHARHDGGDHVIMIGRVVQLQYADGDPLLYFRGQYRRTEAVMATP